MSNASLVSGISSLTQQEEELEREKQKIMQQLQQQMVKKMRVSDKVKKKKQPMIADVSQNNVDPIDATIDQVEEVQRGRVKSKTQAMFDDRFRERFSTLKDVKIVNEVIDL